MISAKRSTRPILSLSLLLACTFLSSTTVLARKGSTTKTNSPTSASDKDDVINEHDNKKKNPVKHRRGPPPIHSPFVAGDQPTDRPSVDVPRNKNKNNTPGKNGNGGTEGGDGTRPTSSPLNPLGPDSDSDNKHDADAASPTSTSTSSSNTDTAEAQKKRLMEKHRSERNNNGRNKEKKVNNKYDQFDYSKEFYKEIQAIKDAGASDEEVQQFILGRKRAFDAEAAFKKKRDEDEREREQAALDMMNGVTSASASASGGGERKVVVDNEGNILSDSDSDSDSEPSSQPTAKADNNSNSNPNSNSPTPKPTAYSYEHTYDEIFQPNLEEYDMINFDPYSFSGAPLGGWGRATRSRLASLPIRLVSDFEGGMDLLFGSSGSGGLGVDVDVDADADADVDESEETDASQKDAEGQAGSASSHEQATKDEKKTTEKVASKSKSLPKDLKPSIGPHYSIHDSTGQRYVCRAYAEDELTVLSRMDSVFHPAVHVWDDAAAAETSSGRDSNALDREVAAERAKKHKHFQFSINNKDGIDGFRSADNPELPSNIRESVTKILRNMGMNDAAAALERGENVQEIGLNGEVDVDVDVQVVNVGDLDVAATEAAGDRGGAANGIADIIKAAAVGAGMEPDRNDPIDHPVAETKRQPSTPAQLSLGEIYSMLNKLNNLCSQLHMGWWSYEWCHQEQIRQFHVAINTPKKREDNGPKYAIEDVTPLGKFNGEVQIIYPRGEYDGKMMAGKTLTVNFDAKGNVLGTTDSSHSSKDDEKYSIPHHLKDNKKARLGHGGPIIRQTFEGGQYCDEADRNREMHVELRCCTEDEIDHWLESKKQNGGQNKNKAPETQSMDKKRKDNTPLAVLVGVQEEETCVYRSRVCTPLLCPKPVGATESSSHGSSTSATKSNAKPNKPATQQQLEANKKDPIGALINAFFDGDMDLDGDNGQVQIIFSDDVTGGVWDEFIRQAENGEDFANNPMFLQAKRAMKKVKQSNSKTLNVKDLIRDHGLLDSVTSRSADMMEVNGGESIREILDNTLGKRPCLVKNLGWWTYEFCHGKDIRQYHANNLIDAKTGFAKQTIETEHLLGEYEGSGNGIEDYPNEDERLHVVNATGSNSDLGIGKNKGANHAANAGSNKSGKQTGGNGAAYIQEYMHGEVCDHEDVAESVIKGGSILHGSVQRSSTVRFSCGKRWELKDIKEDSTCHYILEVAVPELCQHKLFKAPVTKTQVVKCLPV